LPELAIAKNPNWNTTELSATFWQLWHFWQLLTSALPDPGTPVLHRL